MEEHEEGSIKENLIKIIISIIFYIIAFFVKNNYISKTLFLISYIVVGFEVLREATQNIFKGKIFDENFLMAVATIRSIDNFRISWSCCCYVVLSNLAVEKSKNTIKSLMNLRPDKASLLVNGEVKIVNPSEVKINDVILVKPGEKVPLDGIVIEGNSFIDTKALTGESVPRGVKPDEEILSGSINKDGILKIRVTKEFGESTVSKILELVENASESKSKSENFITKFAKIYTPVVVD